MDVTDPRAELAAMNAILAKEDPLYCGHLLRVLADMGWYKTADSGRAKDSAASFTLCLTGYTEESTPHFVVKKKGWINPWPDARPLPDYEHEFLATVFEEAKECMDVADRGYLADMGVRR